MKKEFLRTALGLECLAVVLFLLAACTPTSQSGIVLYTGFPQTVELKARVIPLDTALFRYPLRIRIAGDEAVVLDLHGADHFCHAFSYPGFRHLASFARRGEAPEEVLLAENVRWNGQSWLVLDSGNGKFIRYGWTEAGDSLLPCGTIGIGKEVLQPQDFTLPDNNGNCLIPDYSGKSRFCRVDRQGRLLQQWGEIPTANQKALQEARPALAQAWRSFVDYNPRNGVLAAVTQLGEVLEVYNLQDSTHVVCIGPHGEPQFRVTQGYGIPTGIMGFSDVQVTDNAIYTVFHGRSFEEIGQSMQKGVQLPDGGKHIYVFNLKGEPLREYLLDRYINGIHVDEQRGIITATDVNSDDPIVEFQMN